MLQLFTSLEQNVSKILFKAYHSLFLDINECWNPCACDRGKECINSVGTYECKEPGRA